MENPFSLVFGKSPQAAVERPVQLHEIVDSFRSENMNQQIYLITGVRGYGKTVLMTQAARVLSEEKNWIHVELNPALDLLASLLSKLNSSKSCLDVLKDAKVNLSFFGFSVGLSKSAQIKDPETAVSEILKQMKKHGKRLLVTIDEATNTEQMRVFTSAFQILLRQDLPVFLLMTGLYKNIEDLQNEENLTFLHRAPRIHLQPLNKLAMAAEYAKIFSLGKEDAEQMASLTRGYPFAFQVLGYLTWENGGAYADVLERYAQYLSEYAYDKIWSELSPKDKEVARGVAKAGEGPTKAALEELGMSQNEFNPYRKRLIKKGVVHAPERGSLEFTLPFFAEYCLEN